MSIVQLFDSVLLLEDDENDRILIERCLRVSSRRIVGFSSLRDACAYLSVHTVDVILCDLRIEDSKGIETFRKIKNAAENSTILILSDLSRDEVAIQAVKEGAQDFLLKDDINSESLELKIRLALERSYLRTKLMLAEKKSAEQSQFKTVFLADFSHEIRTPLNAVIGATSLLQSTQLDGEQVDLVETLMKGGERLLSIVSDILDVSKIESGRFDLDYSLFNVRELVGDVLSIFSPQVHHKKLYLFDYVSPGVPVEIESDSKRIKQILLNLISNALKFTEAGCVVIQVEFLESGLLHFCVRDTGRGLREDKIQDLFKPFLQIEKEDSSCGTGLGLTVCQKLTHLLGGEIGAYNHEEGGSVFWFTIKPNNISNVYHTRQNIENFSVFILSENVFFKKWVSHQLLSRDLNVKIIEERNVERDLKNIYVPSAVVLDDVFSDEESSCVFLERAQSSLLDNENLSAVVFSKALNHSKRTLKTTLHHSSLLQAIAETFYGDIIDSRSSICDSVQDKEFVIAAVKGMNCLIVDDDIVNRKIIEKILFNLGVESAMASNGVEALNVLEAGHPYQFVFMDCTMPEMDGYEASRRLRAKGDQVVIIALTAHAFQEDKKKCLDAGMDLFLSKPIRADDVLKMIRHIVKKSQ